MKKYLSLVSAMGLLVGLSACDNDASVASRNISRAADNFEVTRRIVFYNGITNDYVLTIEGLCSLENASTGKNAIAVTCKTGPADFKKHFLGLSDNVTYFAEQLENVKASVYHYRVTFKPSVILPDIDYRS